MLCEMQGTIIRKVCHICFNRKVSYFFFLGPSIKDAWSQGMGVNGNVEDLGRTGGVGRQPDVQKRFFLTFWEVV